MSNIKFTTYAPEIFKKLIEREGKKINFLKSLNMQKNIHQIKKAGQSKGGKSGELFLHTEDNLLILKSITETEV